MYNDSEMTSSQQYPCPLYSVQHPESSNDAYPTLDYGSIGNLTFPVVHRIPVTSPPFTATTMQSRISTSWFFGSSNLDSPLYTYYSSPWAESTELVPTYLFVYLCLPTFTCMDWIGLEGLWRMDFEMFDAWVTHFRNREVPYSLVSSRLHLTLDKRLPQTQDSKRYHRGDNTKMKGKNPFDTDDRIARSDDHVHILITLLTLSIHDIASP
jgi:hypothetical protein